VPSVADDHVISQKKEWDECPGPSTSAGCDDEADIQPAGPWDARATPLESRANRAHHPQRVSRVDRRARAQVRVKRLWRQRRRLGLLRPTGPWVTQKSAGGNAAPRFLHDWAPGVTLAETIMRGRRREVGGGYEVPSESPPQEESA
jgi:hypothetical protein